MNENFEDLKSEFNLTDYQIKKFNSLFDALDAEKKGVLDYGNFLIHILRIKKRRAWDDRDPAFQEMVNLKNIIWNLLNLLEGTYIEGKLTKTNWIRFWGSVAKAISHGKAFQFGRAQSSTLNLPTGMIIPLMHSTFKTIGSYQSGTINKEDFMIHLDGMEIPMSEEKVDEVWKTIVGDREVLELRVDEMEELIAQWLLNTDENDPLPGDWFITGGFKVQWE